MHSLTGPTTRPVGLRGNFSSSNKWHAIYSYDTLIRFWIVLRSNTDSLLHFKTQIYVNKSENTTMTADIVP